MIVAVTPNLSIDRTLILERPLQPGGLHRPAGVRERPGGKGVNLARTVSALGGRCLVAGFVAGWNGRKFRDLLRREGILGEFEEVEGETRECHVLVDGGSPTGTVVDATAVDSRPDATAERVGPPSHPTELYEGGPAVSVDAWRSLATRLPAATTVLCGSMPSGFAGAGEASLAAIMNGLRTPLVVDTSGPALAAAVRAGAAWISPNRSEVDDLLSRLDLGRLGPDASEREIVTEARRIFDRFGTRILVSLGPTGAALVGERSVLARPPAIQANNPVGSGDALLGAFLWALEEGRPEDEALRVGVAAGADNARRGGGGSVTRAGVDELVEEVRVEAMDR